MPCKRSNRQSSEFPEDIDALNEVCRMRISIRYSRIDGIFKLRNCYGISRTTRPRCTTWEWSIRDSIATRTPWAVFENPWNFVRSPN